MKAALEASASRNGGAVALIQIKILLTGELSAQLERDIFIGFYSVRKLIDAVAKVTDATKNMQVAVSYYINLDEPVHWLNNHKLDELYNMEKAHQETRDLFLRRRRDNP